MIYSRSTGRPRLLLIGGIAALFTGVLVAPDRAKPPPEPSSASHFRWNQDDVWLALEQQFRHARALGCAQLREPIDAGLQLTDRLLSETATRQVDPEDAVLDTLEYTVFELGPLVAACPKRLPDYVGMVTRMRSVVKKQSERWERRAGRDRLYRLLWGGRAAVEEVMLQASPESVSPLVKGDDEPSATPSTQILGVKVHSGDLLVSRGGTPTAALIAVGNDYPGNFSHVAMVHVDEHTAVATIIESNQSGLQSTPIDTYLTEIKLRIMVLRLRSDLDAMITDPLLPHRAATAALNRATRGRDIPYDFAMDHRDDSRMYCSEVLTWAFAQYGIRLWQQLSQISKHGTRRWLSDFGVEHFNTMDPSDLEYDPQVRVVAEWRDPGALFLDHIDNVITEALLDGAANGDRLVPAWHVLPWVRLFKWYSVVANALGGHGPVPEGMSASAAARFVTLDRRHRAIKERVHILAADFEEREGYRPPEWQLLRLAKMARDEFR